MREMDYDPERALWVPRWGRRGFLSLFGAALVGTALCPPINSPDMYVEMYREAGAIIVPSWITRDVSMNYQHTIDFVHGLR